MPVTALFGTKPTRAVSVRSVVSAAAREFNDGNWARGLLLLSVLVLVWTGAVVDLTARRLVGACRSGRPPIA
ncbi:hypothetical protein HYG81_09830 [Natrinema zhouii]|uniref:Uncharacterized protein n=1 Tax=Natrinema zhouii TaxID=1710539 RepID=A0A7D6GSR1_9EURY|nr:hypothetical protein [Natrinema zhouii]QLK24424.1 hypothetical protein HYG81_09830 [Natrinema zhouii]